MRKYYLLALFIGISFLHTEEKTSLEITDPVVDRCYLFKETPNFTLEQGKNAYSLFEWQIACYEEKSALWIPLIYHDFSLYSSSICLSPSENKLLSPNVSYCFQVRALGKQEWSKKYLFQISDQTDNSFKLSSLKASISTDLEYVTPFLLPLDHPVRKKLDKLFKKNYLLANTKSLQKAGFKTKGPRPWSKIVVATHPYLKNYVLKLFTDDIPNIHEAIMLGKRVQGAKLAESIIKQYNLENFMKVPKKWIYYLPSYQIGLRAFIIVEEDMDLVSKKDNSLYWLTSITAENLNGLYTFLKAGGFYDSPMAFNLPFSKDGKIAIIDTEHFGGLVPYHKLNLYLNPKMQQHWNLLIQLNP